MQNFIKIKNTSLELYKDHANFKVHVNFMVRQQQRGQRGIVDRDGDPGPLLDVNADVFIHNGFA